MPHKIKQFTVLYSVADPDLQIRRGGGADHPDPEIGEGCTQFGQQIGGGGGGGLPWYEIEETSK